MSPAALLSALAPLSPLTLGDPSAKFLCTLIWTFQAVSLVRAATSRPAGSPFMFVRCVAQACGGGIFVPLLLNKIPVPLANDTLMLCLVFMFALHSLVPVVHDVATGSVPLRLGLTVGWEMFRASAVCASCKLATAAIPAGVFGFPFFGPVICGTLAGCGAAFLPLDKGLSAIDGPLPPPVKTGLCAALFFTSYAGAGGGSAEAEEVGKIIVAIFLVVTGVVGKLPSKAKSELKDGKKKK
ncbi:hypothetical protein TeGR_g12133 [Tetraparma gracilis]|uniref:Uncharacterized protein n=1 Tax=Tetraparma gracilis TaxID=2962635 RepID=A0ABQ6M5V5_9STRA|nr:hypothetical protein TeGR_g12133 [Tetraparma gracilis]